MVTNLWDDINVDGPGYLTGHDYRWDLGGHAQSGILVKSSRGQDTSAVLFFHSNLLGTHSFPKTCLLQIKNTTSSISTYKRIYNFKP